MNKLQALICGTVAGMAGLGTLPGCTPVTQIAERHIEQELQRLIGPADSYKVKLGGLRATSGRADSLSAIGMRVRPEGAPVLDQVEVDLRDIRYDHSREQLERIGSLQARVWIRGDELATYLRERQGLEGAAIGLFPPDEVTVQVPVRARFLERVAQARLRLSGRVSAEGPRVHYQVVDVLAEGFNLGDFAADEITRQLNPLVDLSGIPLQLDITNVSVVGDRIWITASGSYQRSMP
jgi:hypothetical protein